MTYELPTRMYVPVWALLVTLSISLGYKYRNKIDSKLQSNADEIERYNTSNGYGFGVNPRSIAVDLINPLSDEDIRKVCEVNSISPETYEQEVREKTDRFYLIPASLHALLIIYGLVGILYIFCSECEFQIVYIVLAYVLCTCLAQSVRRCLCT
jgi:hypothetical protein